MKDSESYFHRENEDIYRKDLEMPSIEDETNPTARILSWIAVNRRTMKNKGKKELKEE